MFVILWIKDGRRLYAGTVCDWGDYNTNGMITFSTLESAMEFAKNYIQEEDAIILNTHTAEGHSFTFTGY